MFIKIGRVITICLFLSVLLAGNVMSAPPDNTCKGPKADRSEDCGGDDETPGGEHVSLTVTLNYDPTEDDDIYGDGSDVYSDSEKTVTAQLGGKTQPNKPGFKVGLKRAGRNPREIFTDINCTPLDPNTPSCGLPVTVKDDEMVLSVKPYNWNCPGDVVASDGECPDIFTMGTGTKYMSFRVNYWNQYIFIEFASNIGGDGSHSPGRCLSLLSELERSAFLSSCDNPGDCNVSVTASDNGYLSEGVLVGNEDGENDEWLVSANNALGLICSLNDGTVYGTTQMTFDIHAIKE